MSDKPNTEDPPKRKWRKKRKNFLTNAKKYAKKGQMGRGVSMPPETYQYLLGILDVLKKGIDSTEERDILVTNVLERIKGEELTIIGNQLGSRVIEILIPYSPAEALERIMESIFDDIRRLCSDNFGSHVIEKLIEVASERAVLDDELQPPECKKMKSEDGTDDKTHKEKCCEFVIKICKYLLNNLEDFVWDSYANHILRMAIRCLSGLEYIPGERRKPAFFKFERSVKQEVRSYRDELRYREVPAEFHTTVREFADRIIQWPQFNEMAFDNLTSGFLQMMLYGVKNVDKSMLKTFQSKLLNECFAPDDWADSLEDDKEKKTKGETQDGEALQQPNLPPVFSKEPAVRLLESSLLVARKKSFTQLYAKCFMNRMGILVSMPVLNFSVQRLFDRCSVKEEFEGMFDEVCEHFPSILCANNVGVLTSIVKACLKHNSKQTQFVSHLESALKCKENPKYFVIACLQLVPADGIDKTKLTTDYNMSIHGSMVVQTILDFQRPVKMVNSLLELSTEELLVIFKNRTGSRIADAFFAGQFVGAKSKEKIIHKLKGNLQDIAVSQFGSRALEAMFNASSKEVKVKIMEELSIKHNLLKATQYGLIIHSKLYVDAFIQNKDKWFSLIKVE